jgi:hypothetical protein
MAYEDLTAFVRPGFDLPILGRTYHVPAPSARDGLWLQALMDGSASFALTNAVGAANKAVLSDEEERTLYQVALGGAFDEMIGAGVPWPFLKHAGMTAWVHWCRGAAAGERYWATLREDGQGNPPAGEATETESTPADGSPPVPSIPAPA